jgi:hypothetical protein
MEEFFLHMADFGLLRIFWFEHCLEIVKIVVRLEQATATNLPSIGDGSRDIICDISMHIIQCL